MIDPRSWTDDEVFARHEGTFRADTGEKRALVSRIKQRMLQFEGRTPQTEDEKVEEISALYIAIMEASNYPARMQDLVDRGARSFLRRDEHEADEAYEDLSVEIDSLAQNYFYLKRLLLGCRFGWILWEDITLGKFTTDTALVASGIRRRFRTTSRRREEIDLLAVEYTEEHVKAGISKARFDEADAVSTEIARRNGW